jgi:hypothetical protein
MVFSPALRLVHSDMIRDPRSRRKPPLFGLEKACRSGLNFACCRLAKVGEARVAELRR